MYNKNIGNERPQKWFAYVNSKNTSTMGQITDVFFVFLFAQNYH